MKLRFFVLSLLFGSTIANAQSDCLLTKLQSVANGTVDSEIRNTYDAQKRLTEEWRLVSIDQGHSYTTKKVFEYNAKGYLAKITEYLNEQFKSVKTKTYDNQGNLVSESDSFDPVGNKPINRLTFSSNASEKLFFDENNAVAGREITEKTLSGKISKHEIRNKQGVANHITEYTYDTSDRIIYLKRNDVVGGMIEENYSSYNESGKIVSDSTYLNGKFNGKTLYTYVNGQLIKKTKIGSNNAVDYEFEYTNDELGNVLEERFIYREELLSRFQRNYNQYNLPISEDRFNNKNQLLKSTTWEYSCPN